MPTKKLKKATPHDLAVIRGFAERVKEQAQLEADRIDPQRVAREVDGDEADLARKLDRLCTAASDVIYAAAWIEKR